MEYFRKVKPLKEDGFYLSVTYMFGDADLFQTNVKRFDTEEEMCIFYFSLLKLFELLEGKSHYDDVNWQNIYDYFEMEEGKFEGKYFEWIPTDDGFFLGTPQNTTLSCVEDDGREYELEITWKKN